MKKFIAFIAVIGMVAISINSQATVGCFGGGGSATCVVNTTASSSTFEGNTYFGNPYQLVVASMHVVSFSTSPQGGGIGTLSTEGGSCSLDFTGNCNQGAYRTVDGNPCELWTGYVGYIDISAQAYNNAGYVYVNANW